MESNCISQNFQKISFIYTHLQDLLSLVYPGLTKMVKVSPNPQADEEPTQRFGGGGGTEPSLPDTLSWPSSLLAEITDMDRIWSGTTV